jgi:hypothetical protein
MPPIKRRKKGPQLPEVIPLGLEALRQAAGFMGWESVAKEIIRRERRHPAFQIGASGDTWRKLVKNEGEPPLRYARLELLEGVTGIPTGVMLDVTGAMALLRAGTRKEDALKYAAGLKQLARDIENEARRSRKLDDDEQIAVMERFYRNWKAHGFDASMPLKSKS